MTAPFNPNLAPNLPPQGPKRVVYLEANRAPTVLDTKYRDGSYYEFDTEWRDTSKNPSDIWKLTDIFSKTNAHWMLIGGSNQPVLKINLPNPVTPIIADGTGNIFFTSTGGTVTITGTSANPNNHTVNFEVAGGVQPIEKFIPDTGTNPVTGQTITVTNTSILPTNSLVNAIQSNGTGASTLAYQLQYAGANAGSSAAKLWGVSQYDSNQFDVASGFVQLKGSTTPATTKYQVDSVSVPGVNPVVADSTGKVIVTGGSNIVTESFAVNTITIASTAKTVPGTSNIGFTYSAGTFTITDAFGGTLSATNPAFAIFTDYTTQPMIGKKITTPFTFTDFSGTNDLGQNLFGTTTNVDWATDMPFYLYVVLGTGAAPNDVGFAISRVPNRKTAPAAGNIAIAGNTNATTQGSFFFLKQNGATITAASFAGQPCVCLGSFRMQKSSNGGTTNRWTVQALALNDGIDQWNEATSFSYPVGQNGATATTHFQTVGADTFPNFSSKNNNYIIDRNGLVTYNMFYSNLQANGSGTTVNLTLTLPLQALALQTAYSGYFDAADATTAVLGFAPSFSGASNQCVFHGYGKTSGVNFSSSYIAAVAGTPQVTAQWGCTMSYRAYTT